MPLTVSPCRLCPNHCDVDRTTTIGRCGVPDYPLVSRVALHPWEEPIISGTRGSGTIFFAGCNLMCVFCQNYRISHDLVGKAYTVTMLADAMRRLVDMGAHNVNFVTPTHYAHAVQAALDLYRPPVPVVYNCGGYENVDTLRALEGYVDIYMPDMKYGAEDTAVRYAGVHGYPQVAKAAIAEMVRQQPKVQIKDGIMQKGVLIRHLVLPEHSGESVDIVTYLYKTYGNQIYLSVMNQYTPYGNAAAYPEINRRLKPLEYRRVVAALERMGATQVFVQDSASADTVYIPPFDGE